jgi:hypothetical protein
VSGYEIGGNLELDDRVDVGVTAGVRVERLPFPDLCPLSLAVPRSRENCTPHRCLPPEDAGLFPPDEDVLDEEPELFPFWWLGPWYSRTSICARRSSSSESNNGVETIGGKVVPKGVPDLELLTVVVPVFAPTSPSVVANRCAIGNMGNTGTSPIFSCSFGASSFASLSPSDLPNLKNLLDFDFEMPPSSVSYPPPPAAAELGFDFDFFDLEEAVSVSYPESLAVFLLALRLFFRFRSSSFSCSFSDLARDLASFFSFFSKSAASANSFSFLFAAAESFRFLLTAPSLT